VDQGPKGSLLDLLGRCYSAFGNVSFPVFYYYLLPVTGKRLFRKWLCHPLRKTSDIKSRQCAVDDLDTNGTLASSLQVCLFANRKTIF
jgi:hypothetical protein